MCSKVSIASSPQIVSHTLENKFEDFSLVCHLPSVEIDGCFMFSYDGKRLGEIYYKYDLVDQVIVTEVIVFHKMKSFLYNGVFIKIKGDK